MRIKAEANQFGRELAKVVTAVTLAAGLAGCAAPPKPGPDPVAQAIMASTGRISDAWQKVGAVAEAQNQETIDYLGDFDGNVPPALQKKVSLRWAGPIAGVVKRLAGSAHWQFDVVGNAPVSKVPVFIDTKSQPISAVLRNIGYQAGGRADVVVNPSVPSITVAYHD